ncbi:putative Lysozyme [uncultured delta proteobacterium]|uniref:Lysozyme n=1 Tax=uncultured delta proteobacterium TaxID=34034 RepID=A0A212JI40_9DELT|nr:putative Lysozyme [uncultured delta proteobacterium]
MAESGSTNAERLLEQLRRDEGAVRDRDGRHAAYRCPAGKLTIGYGHNLEANPLPGMGEGATMVEHEAAKLLERDAELVTGQVLRALPWSITLDFPRFAVLVNMAFNMGIAGLCSFTGTLADVKRGDYAGAARRMRASKWAFQVKERARRLIRQMETGQWQ